MREPGRAVAADPGRDPSRQAFEGYRSAMKGKPDGAGHLAWERIAGRFARARVRALERGIPFDDSSVAWVMGYGLGLRDIGRGRGPAPSPAIDLPVPWDLALVWDVVLPWVGGPQIVYGAERLWAKS